jgi:hypothetical protein
VPCRLDEIAVHVPRLVGRAQVGAV